MKKIKGGKRVGAGRKKTGRNTEVVSFSIPKDLVTEIKDLVKGNLSERGKTIQDVVEVGVSVIHTDNEGVEKRIDPLGEEGLIIQQIANDADELKKLPDSGFGKQRKRFLDNRIYANKQKLKQF